MNLSTDHRNLLFVNAPLTIEPSMGRHIVLKVQKWAILLSKFDNVINHVHGEENVCRYVDSMDSRISENGHYLTLCILLIYNNELISSSDEIFHQN